jgi:conjugative relaxase-like TrwC/TraI family protein
MLRINQNRAAASAKNYYSHADYYGEGQELAGCWRGQGAKLLGLQGLVEKHDFDALCDNLDPRSGEPLTVRTKHDRTVGYDFNFHVPKGVSLAYALNQDERIVDALRQSVRETMEEIEQEAKTRVRQRGRQEDRTTGNLTWAEFIHTTARPVDGLPDPHLHAHCFVFNSTFDNKEQRWKAAQFREIKRDAPYFEAAFHARLARRMRGLGYAIRREGRSWDLAKVPKSLLGKFSRRTDQIEELARKKGIQDVEEKAALGAKTREAKCQELSWQELRQAWLDRLDDAERDGLAQLHRNLAPQPLEPNPAATTHAMQQAVLHCFEREAVVPERQILAEALRRGAGEVRVEDLAPELARHGVFTREYRGRRLATTHEVLGEERAVLEFARAGRGAVAALNANWRFERDWLSDEQKRAVRQLLESRDRVQILRGGAGTGKTTLMQEAVAGIEATGRQALTFAPSAQASRGVLREEGFSNATTVAELLVNRDLQESVRGQVIWIDEAGLLGTRQTKRVFDLAQEMDARVVLSGDWRQHGSVERGGVLRLLEQDAGLKSAQVSGIQRQRGRYKDAVALLAAGRTLDGFDRLDALGWVRELGDDVRDRQVARDYAETVGKGESALVISPTHREAEHLTAAIRHELRNRGLLPRKERTLTRLKPLHLTQAERGDAAFYQPGDVIVFQQHAPGHRKGERLTVAETVPESILPHAQRFSVFRVESFAVAVGDCIRLTANGKTKDGKHRLNNGAVYQVAGITQRGDLQLGNGWEIDAQFGHLAYGYVTTSHASQGRTVDRVLIAESAESFPAANREQLYVSVSRGRQGATIYTDDKTSLRQAIQTSSATMTASELVAPDEVQVAQQRRRYDRLRQAASREAHQPKRLDQELAYVPG